MEPGHCYGCFTFYYDLKLCEYTHYSNEHSEKGSCPCVSCIVKSMCDTDCDDFHSFTCAFKTSLLEDLHL